MTKLSFNIEVRESSNDENVVFQSQNNNDPNAGETLQEALVRNCSSHVSIGRSTAKNTKQNIKTGNL